MNYLTRTIRQVSAISFLLAAIAIGTRAESAHPVRLVEIVTASHQNVVLADLLPGDAPAKLRARALSISIVISPQPGITRVLQRNTLLQKLKSSPELLPQLEIPDWIMIRRDSRQITRDEVFRAIFEALVRNHFPQASQLTPESIRMAVPVHVTQVDSGLRVLSINIDPDSGTAFFRIWPSREPKVHPFEVAVKLASGLSAWDSAMQSGRSLQFDATEKELPPKVNRLAAVSSATVRPVRKPLPQPLVTPGQVAIVLLMGNGVQVHTYGLPLERGALGQTIRVRSESTGRIILAQVVARNSLEAAF